MPRSKGLCCRADKAAPGYAMRGAAILSEFGIPAKKSGEECPRRAPGATTRDCARVESGLLMPAVVLVAINLVGRAVLLAIDLGALLGSQFSAIGGPVSPYFFVDPGFVALQVGGFASG